MKQNEGLSQILTKVREVSIVVEKLRIEVGNVKEEQKHMQEEQQLIKNDLNTVKEELNTFKEEAELRFKQLEHLGREINTTSKNIAKNQERQEDVFNLLSHRPIELEVQFIKVR
ncbi:chromosome segregation ATPase [Geomicrobium halophilum]|uniref:Chromosome segregation ATPase n=1 Tax=Geomicrobium halophilum TaxID=549000 RepID=A0A841PQ03_9BACL|nr:hypothetical protein [Geomicrobium halophilum]MBB6450907.1 chromosome segregation ATPase [Geomicrobium halophilum]